MFLYIIAVLLFTVITTAIIIFVGLKAGIYFFGAPYVRSSDERTRALLKMLNPKPGQKIIDLGSGDGKLLFEIARRGATAYGVEINPFLVWRTKFVAKRLGLESKIHVWRGNLFKTEITNYDAIVVYGITYLMPRLEKKLLTELKPGTRVISNYFKFPKWKPVKKVDEILLYKKT